MNSIKRKEFATLIGAIGFWLLATHFIFGDLSSKIFKSDLISGFLLIACALISHFRAGSWNVWLACLIGLWVQFAPLALWSHQSWTYINDTFVGLLAMAVALRMLTPSPFAAIGNRAPRGWSYNPSGWNFRAPLVFFGLTCSFLARYMAAYQLGYVTEIWDPFFGSGTYQVITSSISQSFPVSDAGLGALAYTIEALVGCEGDRERWRTRPWAVMIFGILVVPVSIVSIILIISQPVVVGAWCTWCLLTAFLMIIMIPLAIGEFVAGLQLLHQNLKQGKPFWKLLLHGEKSRANGAATKLSKSRANVFLPGVTIPWNLVVSALLGIWMIVAVRFDTLPKLVANSDYILGLLIFAISVIAMGEIVRATRFLNILFGSWIILVPWFGADVTPFTLLNHEIVGIAILLLSVRKGPVRQSYGELDRFVV